MLGNRDTVFNCGSYSEHWTEEKNTIDRPELLFLNLACPDGWLVFLYDLHKLGVIIKQGTPDRPVSVFVCLLVFAAHLRLEIIDMKGKQKKVNVS